MDMHSRAMVEPATTATTDTALALRVTELEAQLAAVTRERDQLRATLDKWVAAVTERDAALKQADKEIQALVSERDGAVAKFNELAGKYNSLVKDWNAAQGQR